MLNIFLRIFLVEDSGHDPLIKIIQLRSSQKLYLEVYYEATQIAKGDNRPRDPMEGLF